MAFAFFHRKPLHALIRNCVPALHPAPYKEIDLRVLLNVRTLLPYRRGDDAVI